MYLRIIGAMLIVAASGGFGFSMAVQFNRSHRAFRQLLLSMDTMLCDLQYRLSPLHVLCREAAKIAEGSVRKLFLNLSKELERQIAPDVYQCMCAAIQVTDNLPAAILPHLKQLGKSMGQYDLEGQVRMMEAAKLSCIRAIEHMETNKEHQLRSYQTLSLCAGAALAVLLF